ncbi:TIM barrel protein [Candidatus Woesearchaeota archaeon]|nr:TIM barrel protein [Candidatus Woesearchaeota archaeon]
MTILIGPSGIGSPAKKGLDKIAKAGMKCAEVAFTHSVYMDNKMAKDIGNYAKKLNIKLSVHAPYYINLASDKKSVITSSKKRILQSAERANFLNAKYVVFHPGYYGKREKDEVFDMVEFAVNEMQEIIEDKEWNVKLAPEVTGKLSQFGDLDELYELHKKTRCAVCVDFAHLKAKQKGKINFRPVFDTMKRFRFSPLHAHFSGIDWSDKGERRHIPTDMNDVKEILNWCRKYRLNIALINEAPDNFGDALKALKLLG